MLQRDGLTCKGQGESCHVVLSLPSPVPVKGFLGIRVNRCLFVILKTYFCLGGSDLCEPVV